MIEWVKGCQCVDVKQLRVHLRGKADITEAGMVLCMTEADDPICGVCGTHWLRQRAKEVGTNGTQAGLL